MEKGLAADLRVVICPKCSNRLAEPTGVPFYICGGCQTILQAQAKYCEERGKEIISDQHHSPSPDLNTETQHPNYHNSDQKLLTLSNSYNMEPQATSSNHPSCTSEVKLRDLPVVDDGKPPTGQEQGCEEEEAAVLIIESSNPLPKQQEELSGRLEGDTRQRASSSSAFGRRLVSGRTHHLSPSGHSFNLTRIECEPTTSSNLEFNHRHHLPPRSGYRDHHHYRSWERSRGQPQRQHQQPPSCSSSSYSRIPYFADALRDSSSRFPPSHQFHNASPSMQFFHPSTEMRRWSYQFSPHYRRCRDGGQGGNKLTSLKQPFDFHPVNMDAWDPNYREHHRYHMAAAHQHSGETHIRPVSNGAPFITCYHCSNVLQLPSDFLLFNRRAHRLKCDACLSILKFQLKNGKHLVPCDNTPETVTSTGDISQLTQTKNSSMPQSHVRDEVEHPSNDEDR